MSRAASRPASAGTGLARIVAGPSAAWPSALAALAASAAAGCDALSAGSLTTIAGRTPGRHAWPLPRRMRGRQGLGGFDDAADAERDQELGGRHVAQQRAGHLVDAPGG